MREPRVFGTYVAIMAAASCGFLYPPVVAATGLSFAQNAVIVAAHVGVTTLKILLGYRGPLVALFNPLFWAGVTLAEPSAVTLGWFLYVLAGAQDGLLVRPSAWYAAFLALLPAGIWAAGNAAGFPHASTADTVIAGFAAAFAYTWLSAEVERHSSFLDETKRRDAERIRNDVRERIAADLHDGLGATFTGMTLRCRVAAALAPAEARRVIEDVLGMTNKALRKIRVLAKSFGPEELTVEELEGMVRELLTETAPGLTVFRSEGTPPPKVDHEFVYHLLHLIGEATVNAVRHGRPDRIGVCLQWDDHVWCLTVEDNGRGLSAEEAGYLERASALANRARHMGARMRVAESSPGARVEFTNASAELA